MMRHPQNLLYFLSFDDEPQKTEKKSERKRER